jgi:hypothetical protein
VGDLAESSTSGDKQKKHFSREDAKNAKKKEAAGFLSSRLRVLSERSERA